MNDTPHSVTTQVLKMILSFVAWIGTVELAQWNMFIAAIGGLCFIVYTVSNTYVLWKERIIRKELKEQKEAEKEAP